MMHGCKPWRMDTEPLGVLGLPPATRQRRRPVTGASAKVAQGPQALQRSQTFLRPLARRLTPFSRGWTGNEVP